jgi:hypothetical protein
MINTAPSTAGIQQEVQQDYSSLNKIINKDIQLRFLIKILKSTHE